MKTLDPRQGYDIFAKDYRSTYEHLDSFDWEECKDMISDIFTRIKTQADEQDRSNAPVAILDAGCGDGRALGRMMRRATQLGLAAEFWGWDISPAMLKVAAKRLDSPAQLRVRDILDPVGSEDAPVQGFSLVTAFFVLVHIADTRDFFMPLSEALSPGGLLLVNSIPQKEGFMVGKGKDAFMINYHDHSADEVAEALLDCGYELVNRQDGQWSSLFLARKI